MTCIRCALTIAGSGIKAVVLAVNDFEEKRNPEATAELLKEYGIEVTMVNRSWR